MAFRYRTAGSVQSLAISASLFLAGCGGGHMSAPTVTGIVVKATPTNQTAYSTLPSPQNQVSFAAYISYSDDSLSSSALSSVLWSDSDHSWVFMNGNIATCTQPSPLPGLQLSTVTATAQVNGSTYTGTSGLYCL
jgi:hypothetical protein